MEKKHVFVLLKGVLPADDVQEDDKQQLWEYVQMQQLNVVDALPHDEHWGIFEDPPLPHRPSSQHRPSVASGPGEHHQDAQERSDLS